MEIREVNHGIANNFGTYIEINKHLKNYPNLLAPILEHELSHTNKVVSMQDFKLDFMMTEAIRYKQLFWFMVKHPKSFTQLLPFYFTKKHEFVYDINLMVMYLIMSVIVITTIYFGGKYL